MTDFWRTMKRLMLRLVAWMPSAAASHQRESSGSGLICHQAWWDNFHILLCRLWFPLRRHQHGVACGFVQPHHTIMTIPGYVFNVLSRPLPSDFAISCQVCTVSPYWAVKTKFLHCWGNKWSGLAVDYFNNRVQTLHPVFGSSHLTLHYMVVIDRREFGFVFFEGSTTSFSSCLFSDSTLTLTSVNHTIAGPNRARPLTHYCLTSPPSGEDKKNFWLWVFDFPKSVGEEF